MKPPARCHPRRQAVGRAGLCRHCQDEADNRELRAMTARPARLLGAEQRGGACVPARCTKCGSIWEFDGDTAHCVLCGTYFERTVGEVIGPPKTVPWKGALAV